MLSFGWGDVVGVEWGTHTHLQLSMLKFKNKTHKLNNSHPSIILITWIDRGNSKIDRQLSNFVFDFQHWKWYHIKREGVVWQPTQHKISKLVYGDNISVPQCSKDHHTNLKYYRFSGLLIIKIASHTDISITRTTSITYMWHQVPPSWVVVWLKAYLFVVLLKLGFDGQ